MADFDPTELEAIIRANRSTVKQSDVIIARLDHIAGYLHSISTAQDRLQEVAKQQAAWSKGGAAHLAHIRGLLTAVVAVLVVIAWNGL